MIDGSVSLMESNSTQVLQLQMCWAFCSGIGGLGLGGAVSTATRTG